MLTQRNDPGVHSRKISGWRRPLLYQLTWMLTIVLSSQLNGQSAEPLDIWPVLAPGETTRESGTTQPFRPEEQPTVTRVENITRPTMTWHPAQQPTGATVLILPGGGFSKVVPDKEGTEAAAWLNQHGVSAFVLSYRTSTPPADGWRKPLQDAQRAMSVLRSRAEEFGFNPNQIGLVGFSAGGQVAARLLCADRRAYEPIDASDEQSFAPAFALLIYPWNLYDTKSKSLVDGLQLPAGTPPLFLVHTDDDRSSSLGTTLLYVACKEQGIPSELHVYGNGGHGYGLRVVPNSEISTWPQHATRWLQNLGVASR